MKKTLCLLVICLGLFTNSFGQVNTSYFKDTTVRLGSYVTGSLRETDGHVYFWGQGTGVEMNMPTLFKIDSTGKETWNTLRDSTLAFRAIFTNAFVDSRYVFAFGRKGDGPFFLAKFDKENGALVYLKDSIPVNTKGILQFKESGNGLRIVYYTYNAAQSDPNWPPAKVVVLNKDNGSLSPELTFGLDGMVPLHIDNDDNLYYNSTNDTLIKYNLPSATVVWKNKTFTQGKYYSQAPDLVMKNGNIVYSMGPNFERAIDDITGRTNWNHYINNSSYEEFHPYSVQFLNDTLYTTWGHTMSGTTNIEYNAILNSVNKLTGKGYLFGNITDEQGVELNAKGFFTKAEMAVDNEGKIYLFGYDILSYERKIKKLNGDGSLVYKMSIPPDSVVQRNFKVIPRIPGLDYRKIHVFNNKPYFLFHNQVVTQTDASNHITWLELDPNAPVVKGKQHYDKNDYQFSSTVVDIQKFRDITYVLKRQGKEIFLERYASNRSLEWQKEISGGAESEVQGFAIDSTGKIAVLSYMIPSGNYPRNENTLNSYFYNNRVVIYGSDGNLLKDYQKADFFVINEKYELLGTQNGFSLFTPSQYYQITTGGYNRYTYTRTNLTDAIFHNNSNRLMHLVNTKDSIYVFSGRLSNSTHPFFLAINKADRRSVTVPLSSAFPYGYLLSAKGSTANPSQVYICGVNGDDGRATLIKYDLSSRAVLWKYKSIEVGDAFKVVEDNHGNAYALIKTDSVMVVRFNSTSGNVDWAYRQKDKWDKMCIDLDVDPAGNKVMAGILKADPARPGKYYSSILEINAATGELLNSSEIRGGIGDSYIQAIESTQVGDFLVGGNINDVALGGLNGFLTVNKNPVTCNVIAEFNIVQDAAESSRYSFVNQSIASDTANYTWYFGDGDSSLQKATTHRYRDPGSYTVKLDVRDGNNCSASVTKTIYVAPVSCTIAPSFSYSQDPAQPTKVYFVGMAEGGATRYNWNFGDGSTDTITNPVHVYNGAGQYLVCFTVSKDASCSKQECDTLTITASRPRLQVAPNPVLETMQLYLEAEVAGNFEVQIIDIYGNIQLRQTFVARQGPNQFTIPVAALKVGMYVVTAASSSQREQTRFLKLR